MSSSVQITTKNGRLIARISLTFFILAKFYFGCSYPFLMAGLWSLVDPLNHGVIQIFFPSIIIF